jgi:hypothetical protein
VRRGAEAQFLSVVEKLPGKNDGLDADAEEGVDRRCCGIFTDRRPPQGNGFQFLAVMKHNVTSRFRRARFVKSIDAAQCGIVRSRAAALSSQFCV